MKFFDHVRMLPRNIFVIISLSLYQKVHLILLVLEFRNWTLFLELRKRKENLISNQNILLFFFFFVFCLFRAPPAAHGG